MANGPRIYNLFPLLCGTVADWEKHLPRIAEMGFDWVYVNSFSYPGFSGSLYAVKDYYRLHPMFQGKARRKPETLIKSFVEAAERHGLGVIMDLVINHTSKDSDLAANHPEFFLREADGSLKSPSAIDPADARKVTVWGDLAEIDYGNPQTRPEIIAYWLEVLRYHLDLGIRGFRGDAAYQVPAEVWARLISVAREKRSDALFLAETLGCRLEQVEALRSAGFDYLFNSAKWWDFHADWLLDQYEAFRHIAPSVAFPESHDTDRYAAEVVAAGFDDAVGAEARARRMLLFTSVFSSGVMVPMGYEYGFRKRVNVVTSQPADWEDPFYDISEYIGQVMRMRAAVPALNEEGSQQRLAFDGSPAFGLLRRTKDGTGGALTLINPADFPVANADPRQLLERHGHEITAIEEVTPGLAPADGRGPALFGFGLRVYRMKMKVNATATEPSYRYLMIERPSPEIDSGRYPVKREVGDWLLASVDMYKEGHDILAGVLKYRRKGETTWHDVPLEKADNDRWKASFPLKVNGRYQYTFEGWTNRFETWRDEVTKKLNAGENIHVELMEGRNLVADIMKSASPADRGRVEQVLHKFDNGEDAERLALMLSASLRETIARIPDRPDATCYDRILEVTVDRPIARFAAWYEMFHRSQGTDATRSATFDDCIRRLPEIRDMGFDVVYFVPIHPIGKAHRKGKNNSTTCLPGEPGSPYAIGSDEGGHMSVHPDLGSLEDFRRFVDAARAYGMEVALDFAIQCSPDHPWLKEHPDWFTIRPDGTIRYAENPPKKYQDIVNVNFYGPQQDALWNELRDVVEFWVRQGVTIFRVDNPHTKPFMFWEWLIRTVQEKYPETIFLAEAFTRPKMMKMLAKLGFTQSYTYFTWRNFKNEIIEYLTELTQEEPKEYMRPNFFPSTPDILPKVLQVGGRAAFMTRYFLAATLSSVYGMYNGFELCEGTPVPGKEEYFNSEKYEYKVWDWDRPGNIKPLITRINRVRHENPALHELENLRFHTANNDNILFYSKMTLDRSNVILMAANVNPFEVHEAAIEVPVWEWGLPDDGQFELVDLLTGEHLLWRGKWQHVHLDPAVNPVAIWRVTTWHPVSYKESGY